MIVASSLYRSPDACHGPCYVLDPFAYELGERVVIETISAKNPPVKKPRKELQKRPARGGETRWVVVWPPGRPCDFRIVNVPVRTPEPVWAFRARELRGFGWSQRKIIKELGVRSRRHMQEILA